VTASRTNIFDLDPPALTRLITGWGFQRYRADQVWEWLYQHQATSFDVMHTLPAALRERLTHHTQPGVLETVRTAHSSDRNTRKYLLRLPEGQFIETVLMEYSGVRRTACISTQAGCAMGCVFCATGQMGFVRHLTAGEIVEQALVVSRQLRAEGERLSNVVLMGMGEPFHNYEATIAAIRRLNDEDGLNIGQRHITVSTVGLVPAIRRFAAEGLQVRLAISLHAATDEERSALLPINRRYGLQELLAAVHDYVDQSGRRVTFEWAMIAGENDTPEQAHQLGRLLAGLLCHVNLIPLNPTEGFAGQPANLEEIGQFVAILETYHIPATVRVRRGIDIHAGCGQLVTSVSAESPANR
jgi:23S rRNA (adenine2503-C2)-methyltransferase